MPHRSFLFLVFLLALAGLARPATAASVTALSIHAQAGTQESIHTPQLLDEAGGWRFEARRDSDGGISIRVLKGIDTWNLAFRAPTGVPLTVGSYEPCLRSFGAATGLPSLLVWHAGYATTGYHGGRFAVREIRLNGETVEALHVVFEQRDGLRGESVVGELWFRADAPAPAPIQLVSGVVDVPVSFDLQYAGATSYAASGLPSGVTLDSAGALRGASAQDGFHFIRVDATQAAGPGLAGTLVLKLPQPRSVTGLTVRGEAGDVITNGQNYDYSATDGVFTYQTEYVANGVPSNGIHCVFIDGRNPLDLARWELSFSAPGGARLAPGRYEDVGDYSIFPQERAGMSVTGNHSGIGNGAIRSFEVHEVEYGPSNILLRLSVSFTQTYEFTGATLRGELRFQARNRITSAAQASAQRGGAFSYQAAANVAPTSFSAQGLPAGLSIDPLSGLITGTPLESGYFYPAITARGPGGTAVLALALAIGPLPPRLATRARVSGRASTPFQYQIVAENEILAYTLEGYPFGYLPSGLSLNEQTGVISGLPSRSGSQSVLVRASNATGSATQTIDLTIDEQFRQLKNVSTRAQAGPAGQEVIAGFVIEGPLAKPVTVRALGPSLAAYLPNVGDLLADPTLELRDAQGRLLASNDDWETGSEGSLYLTHPKEAALTRTLLPGAYTVVIRGNTPATGIALAEVYDVNLDASQLVNLSTRGWVGTGDRVMIAGFVIQMRFNTRVLIRAVGPSLSSYGVENVLADPTLEVRNWAGQLVASSDDWQVGTGAEAIARTPFVPQNPREPALLLDLQPGAYTAIVRGKDGSVGNALVEVYRMPDQPE